jgi:hypothetical protein
MLLPLLLCRVVLDDFREAYYWLRHNTRPDARIMSWCVQMTCCALHLRQMHHDMAG